MEKWQEGGTMDTVLRWAWFGLVLVALVVTLFLTRYEPVGTGQDAWVWDRWGHQLCHTYWVGRTRSVECIQIPGGE